MAINLDALSHKELEDLINSAESHIKASRADTIKTTRGKIETLLTSNGLTLAEVFPTRVGKVGKTGTVAPKYQNPSNTTQTWSGRGKRPLWFVEALKGRGVTEESLLIAQGPKSVAPAKTAKPAKVAKSANKKTTPKKAAKKAAKK
jgi:DNA-binding protein H-NS